MDPNIILGIILLVPILLIMVLRINAALVFLSLCLGDVLMQFVGGDASAILTSTSAHVPGIVTTAQNNISLVLLLLPVVLTMLIMIRSVRGAKLFFNLFPAIGVGLLGTLLAVPLLSQGLVGSITHLSFWRQLENLQTLILSVSAMLCLLLLWMQRPKAHAEDKHGKHH